ncbi:hypothetical protein OG863_03470 [Streptomyces decoyicus]|uniref:Transposase n=1 Tax=Streptomyces decoyicus TaxID=249567 RepID=A0ABZ1FAS3_9ACTN|nr:hypothetical protein [Streptomyces decoyicus]WSB67105.1 hypothetical protein OG863_03470 [Streptomyces decoyicus]
MIPRAAEALLATAPPADCYLRWQVVRDLATALQGAPLWECIKPPSPTGDARNEDGGPSWPAAAFG